MLFGFVQKFWISGSRAQLWILIFHYVLLFILGGWTDVEIGDERFRHWVQTSLMIGR